MQVVAVLDVVATVGLFFGLWFVVRAKVVLQSTTLTTAWKWAVAGVCVWTAAWIADVYGSSDYAGMNDRLWYAAAVFNLCPLIAVLGAKRPGSRVWTWFVLLPMLLVLGWPALVPSNAEWPMDRLEIEVPQLIGCGLVLVMGVGNYFGTRYSAPAVLLSAALALSVIPFMTIVDETSFINDHVRMLATFSYVTAILAARRCSRQQHTHNPLDRLWLDFRDLFGIVWSKRILDRVNQAAQSENWPVRLEMHGFVWQSEQLDPQRRQNAGDRAEHTLRWLLRRFVDPEWIDERLSSEATALAAGAETGSTA